MRQHSWCTVFTSRRFSAPVNRGRKCERHLFRNRILNRKDVCELFVKCIGPHDSSFTHVYELYRRAYPLPRLLHASLKYPVNPKFVPSSYRVL